MQIEDGEQDRLEKEAIRSLGTELLQEDGKGKPQELKAKIPDGSGAGTIFLAMCSFCICGHIGQNIH